MYKKELYCRNNLKLHDLTIETNQFWDKTKKFVKSVLLLK